MGNTAKGTVAQAEEGGFERVPRPVERMFVDQYLLGGRAWTLSRKLCGFKASGVIRKPFSMATSFWIF